MGNNLCFCCPPKTSSNGEEGGESAESLLLSPRSRSRSNSKILGFIPVDDDWADEIWYDANQSDRNLSFAFSHDDYHDALEDHHEAAGDTFEVTDEELEELKTKLMELFPEGESEYFSDAYLRSVASKPYSKDPTQRRPLDYTLEKLVHVLQWRQENKAAQLPKLIDQLCARGSSNNTTEVPSDAATMKMIESLNTSSMYWHGLTKQGRPILWIRTSRKFWYPNVQAEVDALIVMADIGIAYGMPEGITDFVVISHSYKPPPPNPPFAFAMLKGLVKGYPDRMHSLHSAPVSGIVEFCMNLLLPIMPGRLAHKFKFYNEQHARDYLSTLLLNGSEDIPTFLGGPNTDHDLYYPENTSSKSGSLLKFDWYGMKERLQKQCDLFTQQQQQQQQTKEQLEEPLPNKPTGNNMILYEEHKIDNGIIT